MQKNKQLALQQQIEARLQTIINACPVPSALHDADHNVIFINPEFTQCFGYTLADIPTLADWYAKAYPNPDYRQSVINAINQPLELHIGCKNGTTCTAMLSVTPLDEHSPETPLVIFYEVSTQKIAKNTPHQSLSLLQSVLDNLPTRIFWKDTECRYLGCNAIFAKDAGFTHTEQVIGKEDSMMSWREQAELYRADDVYVMTSDTPKLGFEEQQTTPEGHKIWLRTSKIPLHDETGQVMGVLGIYDDITESKQAADSLLLAASVFAYTQEGIVITDVQGCIIDANRAFTEITGYKREDILGNNLKILQSGRHDRAFYNAMWTAIRQRGFWRGEIWNRRKNGEIYAEWLTISAVTDAQGGIIRYIGSFTDISLLKQREHQLKQVTHYDLLTGLPNRILLVDRISLAIAQSKRNHCLMAVCYLDIDNFQLANNQFGEEASDQLLVETMRRMKNTLREEDTLARVGGDEFVFLLQDLARVEDCEQTLYQLLKAIAIPLVLQNQTIIITASIGISIFPEDDTPPDTLLRHASQAMYQAKQTGKNAFCIYDMVLDRQLHSHRMALNRIEQAFENGEFELYFQPKVDMQQGIVFGAEALIRWQHLERGLVMPKEFLPLIEHNEFANRLDMWVINNALQYCSLWQQQGLALKISVNVSARSLQATDFLAKLNNAFEHNPLANRYDFELEILETELLHDLEKTAQIIKCCQTLGVQFALDDFGTGYSSLSYLRHLPIQTLKIDQSFVRDMLDDDNDLAIVRSVIGLADSFNRQVIAEGVESLEHGTALMAMGCHQAQGYIIAKPMPANDFIIWLQNWKMPSAWQRP